MDLVDGERSLEKALVGEGGTVLLPLKRVLPRFSRTSLWQRVCGGGLHDRSVSTDEEITGGMRIDRLARLWLAEKADEGILPQTLGRYETSLRTKILPALGRLRLVEAASVSRLDRFFKSIAASHPASARNARTVLGQMLAMAVRHDALDTNPVRELVRRRNRRRNVRALDVVELARVRAAIRAWYAAQANRPGPRHNEDLADIVDLLLATGARLGEVLALRWSDVNLAGPRATVTLSGTVVYVKGRGYFRQDETKSTAGYRTLVLPRSAVAVMLRRCVTARANPHDAVFASRGGNWLSPHNVRRQWRQVRAATGLEWVTPHTFRRTVATLLDREADTRTAAAQLGHASEQVTSTYYIDKATVAPDVSTVLQTLGDDPTSDCPL